MTTRPAELVMAASPMAAPPMAPPMVTPVADLAIADLAFGFTTGPQILHRLSLTARAGEVTCLLGPNGAGKSTLLRCILGRLTPSAGQIRFGQADLTSLSASARARLLAYVPQQLSTTFPLTVRELVLTGRFAHAGLLGLATPADLAIADDALAAVGSAAFAHRPVHTLSGGEAQCVMIARAIAQQPAAMLLDEPTSHLDLGNQSRIHRLLAQLAAQHKMAVLCVSHDVNLAAQYADQLVLLGPTSPSESPTTVIAAGPSDQVLKLEHLHAAYGRDIQLLYSPAHPIPIVMPGAPLDNIRSTPRGYQHGS